MQELWRHKSIVGFSLLFIAISSYLIWADLYYFILAPIGLIAIYFAIFYTEYTFLAIGFLTPLSVNIEEYTESFGLYVPTEPLLFGLMMLLLFQHLKKNGLDRDIWKHPIIWAVGAYLFWIVVTSIMSSDPLVSFKFLLARLWFIVPLLFFGTRVFNKPENIFRFIWLFCTAMLLVVVYTLVMHAGYSFGEKEGHWVMWPFFKDHTIYGATIALVTPLIFGIYFSKKHSPLVRMTLVFMIGCILVGLYFSYSRAAWLSVIAALMVLVAIKLRIKFSILFSIAAIGVTVLYFSWDTIQIEMSRNKHEHTTEEFGEKLQSATNVTTDASNLERLNRWSCAIEMFKERPVFGFGPGTYAFEYARFQHPDDLTIISTNFGDMGNAHSEYLGPLAEMGAVGLITMLVIVIAIFYKSITLYYKWPPEDRFMRTLLLSMILALVTYFVHGALNNYLDTDKAAVPVWVFCAAFIGLEIRLRRLQAVDK